VEGGRCLTVRSSVEGLGCIMKEKLRLAMRWVWGPCQVPCMMECWCEGGHERSLYGEDGMDVGITSGWDVKRRLVVRWMECLFLYIVSRGDDEILVRTV